METTPASPSQKRRLWLWFFVVLVALTALAILIPRFLGPLFTGLQPVTPEIMHAAQELWTRKGPRDYDLEYQKKGSVAGKVAVQVRNGKVVSATADGQPLEPRLYQYHSMNALLDDLERFLELSRKPDGPPTVLKAQFNAVTGHLVRYVYVVSGTDQKVELTVRLQPIGPDGLPATPFRP